jgi:hypothetical protein
MSAVKPQGYFADPEDERSLVRFLGYGGEQALRTPEGITFLATALTEGQISIEILDMGIPADAEHWGDGAAVFTNTLWNYDGGEGAELGSTMAVTHIIDMPEETYGETVLVSVAAVASGGVGAWAEAQSVLVPGVTPPDDDELGLIWPDDETIWPDDATVWE